MVLMTARCIIGGKKKTHLDGSVRTPYMVTLDNILYNKNDITKKVVTPFPT